MLSMIAIEGARLVRHPPPAPFIKYVMQPGQGAIVLQAAELEINRTVGWRVLGDWTSLAAGTQEVHQPVEDLPHINHALVAAPVGPGNFRLYQRLLGIGQVARAGPLATVIAGAVLIGRYRKLLSNGRFRAQFTTGSPNSAGF